MWVDSGAASLSIANLLSNFIILILLTIMVGLFIYHYLIIKNIKPMGKKVAGFGILISISIFLINLLMTYNHINFVQEQIAIVNNSDGYASFIRGGWIAAGNEIIVWKIVYSVFFGVLPFWFFYSQYIRKIIN